MKSHIVYVLAVAFSFVVASPIIKQTVADNNSLLSESNDSSTNSEEIISNNSRIEQNNSDVNVNSKSTVSEDHPENKVENDEWKVEIVENDVEENLQNPIEQFDFQATIDNELRAQDSNKRFNLEEHFDTNTESMSESVKDSDYYYNDVIYKDPNEVMEMAAAFVPVPVIRKRKKQTPHKQFATRRYYRRPSVSRRQYYFYPYFNYYRPSSLRYYY